MNCRHRLRSLAFVQFKVIWFTYWFICNEKMVSLYFCKNIQRWIKYYHKLNDKQITWYCITFLENPSSSNKLPLFMSIKVHIHSNVNSAYQAAGHYEGRGNKMTSRHMYWGKLIPIPNNTGPNNLNSPDTWWKFPQVSHKRAIVVCTPTEVMGTAPTP